MSSHSHDILHYHSGFVCHSDNSMSTLQRINIIDCRELVAVIILHNALQEISQSGWVIVGLVKVFFILD